MNHHLITLTSQNRTKLLERGSEITLRRRAEVPDLLARLQALNPEIAQQFEAKEDVLSKLTLRMLLPQPPASEFVPSFIIVSYCWHYRDGPGSWALAPGATPIHPVWEVSQPMVDAIMGLQPSPDGNVMDGPLGTDPGVKGLRLSADEGVWLDKLCIDQKNEAEKSVAIGAMDIVYRSARRLIILLEDVQLNADEEEAGLVYRQFYADLNREVKDQNLEGQAKREFIDSYFPAREAGLDIEQLASVRLGAKSFAMKMLGARWYSRAWCAHESRVVPHMKTNNPLFLCFGNSGQVLAFEFRFIHYFSLLLCDSEPEPPTGPEAAAYVNDPHPKTLWQHWYRIQRLMAADEPGMSLMQHLVNVISFGCLKIRDIVSIALNTSGVPLTFNGDAKEKSDILWIFSLVTIAAGHIAPLTMSGSKMHYLDDNGNRQVSWVVEPVNAMLDLEHASTCTTSITQVTKEFIELDLLLFIDRPTMPSRSSLKKAESILTEHGLDSPEWSQSADAEHMAMLMRKMTAAMKNIISKDRASPMDTLRHTFLALAIDCGLDWILRLPDLLEETMVGTSLVERLSDEPNDSFKAPALSLLGVFNCSEANTPNFSVSRLQPTIRFIASLMDERLKTVALLPRLLRASRDDFALTAQTSNRSWIAVPVALTTLPPSQRRAWVIEPFDPEAEPEKPEDHLPDQGREVGESDLAEDVFPVLNSDNADRRAARNDVRGTWRLRRGQIVFGCQPITPDGESVILLERQKIYGSEDYDWGSIRKVALELQAAYAEKKRKEEEELAETAGDPSPSQVDT